MKPMDVIAGMRRIMRSLLSRLRGWTGAWVLGAILYTGIFISWIFFKWTDPAYETLIAGLGYLPLGLFCVISAYYVSAQKEVDGFTRRAWRITAASILLLVLGDIIYVILELTIGIGFPDIPDFFYLAYYPVAFIGFISFPTRIIDPSQKKTWVLDLAGTSISITAIFWYFIIAPTGEAGGEDWFARIVAGAYPAMDMLLITSLTSQFFRKSDGNTRRTISILGLGLLIFIIADIAFGAQVLQNEYFSGSWVDALYTLSYLLIGLAAFGELIPSTPAPETADKPGITWQASLLPLLAVCLSALVSVYASSTGNYTALQITGLIAGTATAIILIIVRQIITIRENSQLVDKLNRSTHQLQINTEALEERVIERTHELKYQSSQFRLITEIARDFIPATHLQDLLDRSSNSIHVAFKLSQTAVYLLDTSMEVARLTASPTEAGQRLVTENFAVRIPEVKLFEKLLTTGHAIQTQKDQYDELRLEEIWLPETQSAITAPLKAANRVIGILDVQSDNPGAFRQDDLNIFQIIADQLATAIERTRLADDFSQTMQELERTSGLTTRAGWRDLAGSNRLKNKGYRFDNIRIEPVARLTGFATESLSTGKIISRTGPGTAQTIAIPIKLRGQPIGVVQARLKEGSNERTVETLQLAIERLASALESARLYEQASQRADREQAISQITNAIGSSSEYETIMRTTVRELGNLLNDTDVAIHILTEDETKHPA